MSTPTADPAADSAAGQAIRRLREGARRGWYWAADYRYAARRLVLSLAEGVPPSFAEGRLAPVVLIAGVMEPWTLLRPMAERLNSGGHPIHVVPDLAYNLGAIVEAAVLVRRLIAERDLSGVLLVAHSKGGLVGKQVLAMDVAGRVDRLIAIATPFEGSRLANLVPLRSIRALRPSDPTIRELAAQAAVNCRITSIYPAFDPHVPDGSFLPGATNVPLASMGHFRV
ncbi:MAG: hypothetical protein WCF12_13485, partial [Propionicimonas sp.]